MTYITNQWDRRLEGEFVIEIILSFLVAIRVFFRRNLRMLPVM